MDSAQPPLKYHGSHPALEARREGWRGGEGEEHNRTAWASYGGQRVEEVVRAELGEYAAEGVSRDDQLCCWMLAQEIGDSEEDAPSWGVVRAALAPA